MKLIFTTLALLTGLACQNALAGLVSMFNWDGKTPAAN